MHKSKVLGHPVGPEWPRQALHRKGGEKLVVDEIEADVKKLEMVTSQEITLIREAHQLLTSPFKHCQDSCICVFWFNQSVR